MSRARPGLMQGDVVRIRRRGTVVIIGRSCDLPRKDPRRVHVAPLTISDHPDDLNGFNPRLVRVPAKDENVFSDMTQAYPVDKRKLPDEPLVRGCRTAAEHQQFRREVGRYFSMSSLPDGVNETVNELWSELRKRRKQQTHAPLIDRIEDIRVRFMPDCAPEDETTPRSMMLIFVISSDVGEALDGAPGQTPEDFGKATEAWRDAQTVADQAASIDGYCRLLADKCSPHPPVTDLDLEITSSSEVTRDQLLNSYPVRVEAMST